MKKYLLILGLAVGLSSCTKVNDSKHEINYKGHNYIVFEHGHGLSQSYSMSVIHDPDCPCHKRVLKE